MIFECYTIKGIEKNNGLDILKLESPLKNNNEENDEIKIEFNKVKDNCQINIIDFVERTEKKKRKRRRRNNNEDYNEDENELFEEIKINCYDKAYEEKIGILDSLGIDKNTQNKFFEKYRYDRAEGFYNLFKTFMENGTSKNSFLKIMND